MNKILELVVFSQDRKGRAVKLKEMALPQKMEVSPVFCNQ